MSPIQIHRLVGLFRGRGLHARRYPPQSFLAFISEAGACASHRKIHPHVNSHLAYENLEPYNFYSFLPVGGAWLFASGIGYWTRVCVPNSAGGAKQGLWLCGCDYTGGEAELSIYIDIHNIDHISRPSHSGRIYVYPSVLFFRMRVLGCRFRKLESCISHESALYN